MVISSKTGEVMSYTGRSSPPPVTSKAHRHQRAHRAHLAMVLVVMPRAAGRRRGSEHLALHLPNPVLGRPGVRDVVEQMRQLQCGLVALTDVGLAVAADEIGVLGLLDRKSVV